MVTNFIDDCRAVSEFHSPLRFVLTDIDDTLTNEGKLGSEAYEALWALSNCGIQIVPVTGRPAGWCEMIARTWPVAGVVGENGGFYFRYHLKKMHRYFANNMTTQVQSNEDKLKKIMDNIKQVVLEKVPGCAVSSDQFCRLIDLAIDFCEDVEPLPAEKVDQIVEIFNSFGAQAKISSIHVNGWFGNFNKLSTSLTFLKNEFSLSEKEVQAQVGFCGDSLNDEPMFEFFENSFAVANIKNFWPRLKYKPKYVASQEGGLGFAQIAQRIIYLSKKIN